MESSQLLQTLITDTQDHLDRSRALLKNDASTLNHREEAASWSALECIQHLNLYADFYHPELERRIGESKFPFSKDFKTGILGNYFAKSMLPSPKMKKIKTFKSMNPLGSQLNVSTIDTFIKSQEKLLSLLEAASKVDWNKTKTSISISSLIKLRLGDTFRVVIYHNARHILQAERAVEHSLSAAMQS